MFRQVEETCDDTGTGSCSPAPYKIGDELYEWICKAVPVEQLGDVVGLAEGGDFDIVKGRGDSDLLAARRTGACPHLDAEWLTLRRIRRVHD